MNDRNQPNSIPSFMGGLTDALRQRQKQPTDFDPIAVAICRRLDDLAGLTEVLIATVREQTAALDRIAVAGETAAHLLIEAKREAGNASAC